ncbi:MAG: PAS domain S-box protein, partial [Anaerovoracaceae bacterium]
MMRYYNVLYSKELVPIKNELNQSRPLLNREAQGIYEQQKSEFLFEHRAIESFEVNIATRTMRCSKAAAQKHGFSELEFTGLPESVIAMGKIHPASVEAYRKFYEDIFSGVPSGSCLLRLCLADNAYNVIRLHYKTIFDEHGSPLAALGFSEDVEQGDMLKFTFDQEDQLYELLQGKFVFTLKVNLTKNAVERVLPNSWAPQSPPEACYDDYLKQILFEHAGTHEQTDLYKQLNSNALTQRYEEGDPWVYSTFRISNSAGRLFWTAYHGRLLVSPYNGDLYLFAYLRDIDEALKAERQLSKKEQRNKGRIYTKETLEALASLAIDQNKASHSYCGLMVLQVSNLQQCPDSLAASSRAPLQAALCRKLSLFLGNSGILGEGDQDQFLIFCPKISSPDQFYAYAQQLMLIMSSPNFLTVPQEQSLLFKLGVAACRYVQASFSLLFETASEA